MASYKPNIGDLLKLNREDHSRREFLKMAALIGGAIVAPGVLEIACSPAAQPGGSGPSVAKTPKKGGGASLWRGGGGQSPFR